MELPEWLPEMASISPWEHDTYERLYDEFHNAFIVGTVQLAGKTVGYDSTIVDEKENGFWHITTKTSEDGDRLPDPRRCEKLVWLKPMIENSDKSEVLVWEEDAGKGSFKIYVWLENYDYVAVIKKNRNGKLYLVTAYAVEYPNVRRKLKSQYNKSKKPNKLTP